MFPNINNFYFYFGCIKKITHLVECECKNVHYSLCLNEQASSLWFGISEPQISSHKHKDSHARLYRFFFPALTSIAPMEQVFTIKCNLIRTFTDNNVEHHNSNGKKGWMVPLLYNVSRGVLLCFLNLPARTCNAKNGAEMELIHCARKDHWYFYCSACLPIQSL